MAEFADTPPDPLSIAFDAGPIVGDHRVVIDTLGWFPRGPSAWKSKRLRYLDLSYSFVPPLTPEEHDSPIFPWKIWELKVHDDVGTKYDSSTGGVGVNGGDREIHPSPPEKAKTLTLSIGTPVVLPEGGTQESTVVAQLVVDLKTGSVRVMEDRGQVGTLGGFRSPAERNPPNLATGDR